MASSATFTLAAAPHAQALLQRVPLRPLRGPAHLGPSSEVAAPAVSPAPPSPSVLSAAALATAAAVAGVGRGVGCRPRAAAARRAPQPRTAAARRASQQEWRSRCTEVSGGVAVFDVSVPKPLGAELRDFPDRPGVGIASIKEGAGCWTVNEEVLVEDKPGMWILEGDEVVAVEGTPCAGDLEKIVELVMASEGDRVTVTLSRNYLKTPKGPIKVVFKPSGGMATVSRGNNFSDIATAAKESVNYDCKEGWCGTCWHKEEGTGKVFKMCKDEMPGIWDNVMPMSLMAAPERKDKGDGAEDSLFKDL